MNKEVNIDSRPWWHYIIIIAVVAVLLGLNYCYLDDRMSSNSEVINNFSVKEDEMNKVRIPAVAGLFYAADANQLSVDVEGYLKRAEAVSMPQRPEMLIVPHAGYQYSAIVAASAYKKLQPYQNEIKNVILVGPSHRVAFSGIALPSSSEFITPLGRVSVNQEIIGELATQNGFVTNDAAHAKEHSLEVQIPFLQKTLKNFQIIPLVYGEVSPDVLAQALLPYLKRKDTIIVFSADLSHYLDYNEAKTTDEKTAELVSTKTDLEDHRSCGVVGINASLRLAKTQFLQPRLLDMANSGDTGGERDSVVGYASWAFLGNNPVTEVIRTPLEQEVENIKNFATLYGNDLVKITESALNNAVLHHKHYNPPHRDFEDNLFNKGASFITLTKDGRLRGCIGSLIPKEAIAMDVAENTYRAAMEDNRFPELTAEELPSISFTISLLSDYERIRFESEEDLLNQIVAGTDGLVLRDGDRQGLFLPSVWKELPNKKEFLQNLKLKAGMSPSYWSDKIKVYRFRVVEIKKNEN